MVHWDNSIKAIQETIKELCDGDLHSKKRILRVLDLIAMEEMLWYYGELSE